MQLFEVFIVDWVIGKVSQMRYDLPLPFCSSPLNEKMDMERHNSNTLLTRFLAVLKLCD